MPRRKPIPSKRKKKVIMNLSQYARHRDVTFPTITRIIQKGIIDGAWTRNGKNHYEIDVKKADKLIEQNLDQSAPKYSSKKSVPFMESKAKKEEHMAALKEIELKQKKKELIAKSYVDKQLYELGLQVKNSLLNIPQRISAKLSIETDELTIQNILTEELEHCLLELTNDVN